MITRVDLVPEIDTDSEIDSEILNVFVPDVDKVPPDCDSDRVVERDSDTDWVTDRVVEMEVVILTDVLSRRVLDAVMGNERDVVKVRLVEAVCDADADNENVMPLFDVVMGMDAVSVLGRDCVSVIGRDCESDTDCVMTNDVVSEREVVSAIDFVSVIGNETVREADSVVEAVTDVEMVSERVEAILRDGVLDCVMGWETELVAGIDGVRD